MSKLMAILESDDNRSIKIFIENEVEQIAALIKSAKEVSQIRFYYEGQEECLFTSTKKGFIIYDGTWGIFAQDIAEYIFKTKQKVYISDIWIDEERQDLEKAIIKIKEYAMPIDCSIWEEARISQ